MPFIFTQIFLPVEWTLGLATVLVQMAGSNTSLTSAPPQPPPTLGRVTQEQSWGAFPVTRKHTSAMSSDLAIWGQGTIHLSRRVGITAERFKGVATSSCLISKVHCSGASEAAAFLGPLNG